MDKCGLPEKTIEQIISLLKTFPEVKVAKIFGSRAKGTYKIASDIDIALIGNIDEKLLRHIASELEELPTPYKFDVLAYGNIINNNLKLDIDQYGINLY